MHSLQDNENDDDKDDDDDDDDDLEGQVGGVSPTCGFILFHLMLILYSFHSKNSSWVAS